MNSRTKKFVSYYRPYLGLLLVDMICAFTVSAITLVLPLCTKYITKTILEANAPDALNQIYTIGAIMVSCWSPRCESGVLDNAPSPGRG